MVARRRLILLSTLLGVLVVAYVLKGEAEDATRARVVGLMGVALGEDFTFDDIDLSNLVSGDLSIGSLTWGESDERSPLMQVKEVRLSVDPQSILSGQSPRLSVMELEGLVISLYRDGDGVLNVVRALHDRPTTEGAAVLQEGALPDILRVRNGSLELMDERAMREPILLSSIDLELWRAGVPGSEETMREVIGEVTDDTWGHWVISGLAEDSGSGMRIEELDLRIDRLRISAALKRCLGGSLRTIWMALDPQGEIDGLRIMLSRDEYERLQMSMEVDTHELRIPILDAAIGTAIGRITAGLMIDSEASVFDMQADAHASAGRAEGVVSSPVLVELRGRIPRDAARRAEVHLELARLELEGRLQQLVPRLLELRAQLGTPVAAGSHEGRERMLARLARLDLEGTAAVTADLGFGGALVRPEIAGRVQLSGASLIVPGTFDLVLADQIEGGLSFSESGLWIEPDEVLPVRIDGLTARVTSAHCFELFSSTARRYELVVEMPGVAIPDSPVVSRLEQVIARASKAGDESKFLQRLRESRLDGRVDLAIAASGCQSGERRDVAFHVEAPGGLELVHRGLPGPVKIERGQVLVSSTCPAPADGGGPRSIGIELRGLQASTAFGGIEGSGSVHPGEGAELTLSVESLDLRPELHGSVPVWARCTWDALQMSHSIGLTTTLRWREEGMTAEVDARDATIAPLGVSLTGVAGHVVWGDGAVSISGFSGRGLGGSLEAPLGRITTGRAGCTFDLQVAGRGLELRHPELARMLGGLPAPSELRPDGQADFTGSLHMSNWDARTLKVDSAISIPRLELYGRHVEDARGRLGIDRGIVEIEDVHGRLHGGELSGTFSLAMGKFCTYEGEVRIDGVRLEQLVASFVGEPDDRIAGELDGALVFSGVVGNLESLEGRGSLRAHSAWLRDMPPQLARMDGASARQPEAGSFRDASADFALRGRQVTILESTIGGSKVGLHGFGELSLSGSLGLDVLVGSNRQRDYASALRDAPVSFHVTGTFMDPSIDMQLLPGLGGLFEDLGYALGADLPDPAIETRRARR